MMDPRAPLYLIAAAILWSCGPKPSPSVEPENNDPECTGGKCDVIGDDDRYDEFSGEVNDVLREAARSTAMLIANENLLIDGDTVGITSKSLGETYYMCPGEAFRDQPVAGFCSAWLVAADVMVTNGHCITSQQRCEESSFVFDYSLQEEGQDLSTVPAQNVVGCKRVLAWDNTSPCDVDYAVVQLERPVDREPVKVRGADEELAEDALVVIGHPFGLPRKFALNGDVLVVGDNDFLTTHDGFGGDSGSALFDANTGIVQGLLMCGGSNLSWQYWDQGWTLDRKTGQACDMTCDDAGLYPGGAWEETCTAEGKRRRCVCDDDGSQLIWEQRDCLPFEDESQGQCSREYTVDLFSCQEAPWRCALSAPTAQHTRHFVHLTEGWTVFDNEESLEIPAGAAVESKITIEDDSSAQAFSVFVDILGDTPVDELDPELASQDLTVRLTDGERTFDLVADGFTQPGTARNLENNNVGTLPFQVPFIVPEMHGEAIAGEWTLQIENLDFVEYTLHGWRIQAIAKGADEVEPAVAPCLGEDCVDAAGGGPEPIVDNFQGEGVDVTEGVDGTVAENWSVTAIDPDGSGYEAFKTRRSQTIALQSGEMSLTRDFETEIGGRVLTVDFRYDGEGWFQILADGQILHSAQEFSQREFTIPMPYNARTIQFVLGATDDSRFHEATIYRVELGPNAAAPETCAGVYSCTFSCLDATCQDSCWTAGAPQAQTEFESVVNCINDYCGSLSAPRDYQNCVNTTCAQSLAACFNE